MKTNKLKNKFMNNEFKWTDELVKEAIIYSYGSIPTKESISIDLDRFKESKFKENDTVQWIDSGIRENFPKPKEYEILSFKHDRYGIMLKDNHGNYQHVSTVGSGWACGLFTALANREMKIFSVCRLSDGEVFSINDNIAYKNIPLGHWGDNANGCIITHFSLFNGNIYINNHYIGFSYKEKSISEWVKVKKILLTTEDGVNIFEGGHFYEVVGYAYSSKVYAFDIDKFLQHKKNDNRKCFSTEGKANEYILLNRNLLSVNDVLSFTFPESVDEENLKLRLKELAQSKINPQ